MTKLAKKAFLNRDGHHSVAAISYRFSVDKYGYLDGEITISDCSKVIYLDVSAGSSYLDRGESVESEFENGLEKIRVLLEVLTQAEKDYILAMEQTKIKKNVEVEVETPKENDSWIKRLRNNLRM